MALRFAIVTLAVWLLPISVAASCTEGRVDLRGPFGSASFTVTLAVTPQERARGLMFVEEMATSEGMLFLFPDERPRSFWMRNTLIPLDILFFDRTGTLVGIQDNAVPLDETPLPSGAPAQYVLEINGGLAERLGIAIGAELRHPALDPGDLAWPCPNPLPSSASPDPAATSP